jgi:hypothetical protein
MTAGKKKKILNSYYKTPKVPKSPFFFSFLVRSRYHYSPLPYVYLFILLIFEVILVQ